MRKYNLDAVREKLKEKFPQMSSEKIEDTMHLLSTMGLNISHHIKKKLTSKQTKPGKQ